MPSELYTCATVRRIRGFSLMEVLVAMLVLAIALSALLAALMRGSGSLRQNEAYSVAVQAVENLAESIKSNPQFKTAKSGIRRKDYSLYLNTPPSARCDTLPSDGSTPKMLAAYHLCRLKTELAAGLPNMQTAFTVCRDDRAAVPQINAFGCNGRGRGLMIKAVWQPKNGNS
ncbi:MAG: prepilin-type N-terminal cleavage/methylation domain-containing protein, partial [Neisseria sp.]|nr:prepilin-type N-terminal cleavage/methylation domain-containing protein [Neisseria sp.]